MGNTDSIPVVSQAKSAVQALSGDTKAAEQTQINFVRGCPLVSQGYAAVVAIRGDREAAKESQIYFGNNMSNLANGIPVIGHIKGSIHYICKDKEGGNEAMKSASRSVGVLVGGVGGMVVGGPIGAVALGISGGAAMDGIITGVESAVHKKYRPYGHVHMATRAHRGELNSGDWFDWAMMPIFDGLAGRGYGQMYKTIRALAKYSNLKSAIKAGVESGQITLQEGETISSLAEQLQAAAKELKLTHDGAQAQGTVLKGQKTVGSMVIDVENQHVGYNFKLRQASGIDAFNGQVPSAAQIIEQRLPGRGISLRGAKQGQAQCAEVHALHKHHNANGLASIPTRTITVTYDGKVVKAIARCDNCKKVGNYVKMGDVPTDALKGINVPLENASLSAALDLLAPFCACENEDCSHNKKKPE